MGGSRFPFFLIFSSIPLHKMAHAGFPAGCQDCFTRGQKPKSLPQPVRSSALDMQHVGLQRGR